MPIRYATIIAVSTLLLTACGDELDEKTPSQNVDAGTEAPDSGTEQDATTPDASVECDEGEFAFEGECIARALGIQATVVGDALYSISANPYEVGTESTNPEPFNEACSVIPAVEDEPTPELPTCWDGGVLTVTSTSSADPLELGYLQDCYSTEIEAGFAAAGDEVALAFAGGADAGPATLRGALPETPQFEATSNPDGSLSFVSSNPETDGDVFLFINPEEPGGTGVTCLIADGESLDISADDVAFIETTLGPGARAFAAYARYSDAIVEDTYYSLNLFSFQPPVYEF